MVNVFFDIDYTLMGDDASLRPGTIELFERLRSEGHLLHIWSGRGVRWPEVRKLGLQDYIEGVYEKPLYRHFERLELLGVPVVPDFVVDDYQEVIDVFGGATVRPYWRAPRNEIEDAQARGEWDRVYELVASSDGTLRQFDDAAG